MTGRKDKAGMTPDEHRELAKQLRHQDDTSRMQLIALSGAYGKTSPVGQALRHVATWTGRLRAEMDNALYRDYHRWTPEERAALPLQELSNVYYGPQSASDGE